MKKKPQQYFLVNIVNGRNYSSDYFTEEEVEKRNTWLMVYGSVNIQWVTEIELDEILAELNY